MTDIITTIATDPIATVIFGLCVAGGLTIARAIRIL